MKVFILEDDPTRMRWLRERLSKHEITHAESCADIDRWHPPYQLVLLDHDLGGRQMETHEDNGEEFATQIALELFDAVVIIHSYNGAGAEAIRFALGGGFIAPFRGIWFNHLLDHYAPR